MANERCIRQVKIDWGRRTDVVATIKKEADRKGERSRRSGEQKKDKGTKPV